MQSDVFPAFFRRLTAGHEGETLMVEGESSCFYHPAKKAVLPCESCGRFLCALCDCELNGQHICPSCVEAGKTKGKIKSLQNRRTLYDKLALHTCVFPMIPPFIYFTVLTAPVALYISIRYWNAPRSLVHRTKIRFIVAIIFATLQLAAWSVGIYFLVTYRRHG